MPLFLYLMSYVKGWERDKFDIENVNCEEETEIERERARKWLRDWERVYERAREKDREIESECGIARVRKIEVEEIWESERDIARERKIDS